jgi:hypothetical protein
MAITIINTIIGKGYGKGEKIYGKRGIKGRKYSGVGLKGKWERRKYLG